MKKQKKLNIVPIIVPIFSIVGAASVITPAVVCAEKKHVTMDFDIYRWASTRTGSKRYEFHLMEPLEEGQTIEIVPSITRFADTPCHVDLEGEITYNQDRDAFAQKLKMVKNEGEVEKELVTEDRALFNLKFIAKDENGNKIWEDNVYYMSIVYRVKTYDI